MTTPNKDIVHLLRSVGASYILTGGNRFKAIAYQKAADVVEQSSDDVYSMWMRGHMGELQGIGPSILQHLDEYFTKQENSYLEKQLRTLPLTTYELMKAPGIGPKKAYKIVNEFNLLNEETLVSDIRKLASENKIASLAGFGEKSQEDILKAIKIHEKRKDKEERMTLPVAHTLAENVIAFLKKNKHVSFAETLGSLRRMNPTIGDVDVAVVCERAFITEVINHFVMYPGVASVEAKGDEKASIITAGGRRVDLRVIEKERYGSMIQYFTGSKAHNIKLREYALKKGFSLNEFGIKKGTEKAGDGRATDYNFDSEEGFYTFLGLQWIPPEIREGTNEIRLASKNELPQLVSITDIKGEFHVHSNFPVEESHDPGADTIDAMVEMALELGYEYLALSEHNPAQKDHSVVEIVKLIESKRKAVDTANKKYNGKIHILNSLEVDILPNGDLALPAEAFEYLDMVVVSIHSSFNQPLRQMTQRILNALDNPKVKILGHPTARLLGRREGIQADWEAIFDFCKGAEIALEINSAPTRLDLPETLVKIALKKGVKFVIDTDAHSVDGMNAMKYGLSVSRRSWCKKSDIINTLSLDEIKHWIDKNK